MNLLELFGDTEGLGFDVGNSSIRPLRSEEWRPYDIQHIHLRGMLARVGIVPQPVKQVALQVTGDAELAKRLRLTVADGVLVLQCPLPYLRNQSGAETSAETFLRSVQLGNDDLDQTLGRLIVENGELRLDRLIHLRLIVPLETQVSIDGLYGGVGIGPGAGALSCNPGFATQVYANSVTRLQARLTSLAHIHVHAVRDKADLHVEDAGHVTLGSVGGMLTATTADAGRIAVEHGVTVGTSVSTRGFSRFDHFGNIHGEITLKASGLSGIFVRYAKGKVRHTESGLGTVQYNKRLYRAI